MTVPEQPNIEPHDEHARLLNEINPTMGGDLPDTPGEPLPPQDTPEAHISDMKRYEDKHRRILTINGVLNPDEIEECIRYEFGKWPITVGEQVRRYYLQMKDQRLRRAEELLEAVGEIDETTMDAVGAQRVMYIVREYVHGGLIHFDNELYHKYGAGAVSLEVGAAASGCLIAWSADDPTNTTMGDIDTFGLRPDQPE